MQKVMLEFEARSKKGSIQKHFTIQHVEEVSKEEAVTFMDKWVPTRLITPIDEIQSINYRIEFNNCQIHNETRDLSNLKAR